MPGCALVTLSRPAVLNALSATMRAELTQVFERLRTDGATRVAVLTGSGRAFCAGLDLRELSAAADSKQLIADAATDDPVRAIGRFPGPVIAAINGPAVTGGLEMALACDLLLASERASFADTHARVGVLPSWGVSQRLPRLIGAHRAKEMSLTGNLIPAPQAEAWGLVNRVVPHAQLLTEALRLAGDMLSAAPGILAAYKRLIDEGSRCTLAEGLALEQEHSHAWAQGLERNALATLGKALHVRNRPQGSPEN